MSGEFDYLDSLDHLKNFCNVFFKKNYFHWFWGSQSSWFLTIIAGVKELGQECLSDVTSGTRTPCKIENIAFYKLRRVKIAYE